MGMIPSIYKEEIKQLIEALMVDAVPSGFIGWFNLTEAPDGWVVCNGQIYTDSTGTTRTAPNLIGRYPLGALDSIGDTIEAGLPNITGETITEGISYVGKAKHDEANNGAFYVGSTTINDIPTGSEHNGGRTTLYFDASNGTVSSVGDDGTVTYMAQKDSPYGKSTTVTPPSIKLLPCVKR